MNLCGQIKICYLPDTNGVSDVTSRSIYLAWWSALRHQYEAAETEMWEFSVKLELEKGIVEANAPEATTI